MQPGNDESIGDGIAARLRGHPMVPSAAVKPLLPNPLAGYDLQIRDLRFLSASMRRTPKLLSSPLGRKVGNKRIVAGEEFGGHQSDPAEGPPGRRGGRAQPMLGPTHFVELPNRGLISIRAGAVPLVGRQAGHVRV